LKDELNKRSECCLSQEERGSGNETRVEMHHYRVTNIREAKRRNQYIIYKKACEYLKRDIIWSVLGTYNRLYLIQLEPLPTTFPLIIKFGGRFPIKTMETDN
jgi:hypothetical protein